ncbi:helix-turn-helix transcriptional regulator [Devosia sp.]|uniref:helix-turn-helix domain-containing protein n=1 Tax=Devosia sp. TaxID=1871048 RepID=UPI002AFF9F5D|nr:helix-turn-helix transcriptional regulator [Devosia sp.]
MAKRYELDAAPKMPCYFKEWRDSLDWTQEELAAKMETTVAMVSRIETGERDWGKNYLEAFGYVTGCHPLAPLLTPPRSDVDVSEVLRAMGAAADFSPEILSSATSTLRSLARASEPELDPSATAQQQPKQKENP